MELLVLVDSGRSDIHPFVVGFVAYILANLVLLVAEFVVVDSEADFDLNNFLRLVFIV